MNFTDVFNTTAGRAIYQYATDVASPIVSSIASYATTIGGTTAIAACAFATVAVIAVKGVHAYQNSKQHAEEAPHAEEARVEEEYADASDKLAPEAAYGQALRDRDPAAMNVVASQISEATRNETIEAEFDRALQSKNFAVIDFLIAQKLVTPDICARKFLTLDHTKPIMISNAFRQTVMPLLIESLYECQKTLFTRERNAVTPEQQKIITRAVQLTDILSKYVKDQEVFDQLFKLECKDKNFPKMVYDLSHMFISKEMCQAMQPAIELAFTDAAQNFALETLQLLDQHVSPECRQEFYNVLSTTPGQLFETFEAAVTKKLDNVVFGILKQALQDGEDFFTNFYSQTNVAKSLSVTQRTELLFGAAERNMSSAVSLMLAQEGKEVPEGSRLPKEIAKQAMAKTESTLIRLRLRAYQL